MSVQGGLWRVPCVKVFRLNQTMEVSENDWGARCNLRLGLGCLFRVWPAVASHVQGQWDAVDVWECLRDQKLIGSTPKERKNHRDLLWKKGPKLCI